MSRVADVCSWWWGVCACLGVLVRVLGLAGRKGLRTVFFSSSVLSGSVVGRSAARCLGVCTVGCGDGLAGLCWLLAQVCVFG